MSGDLERPWARGALLRGALGSVVPQYWRVVHIRPRADTADIPPASDGAVNGHALDGSFVFLLSVDPLTTPHSTSLPNGYPFAFLAARLVRVDECIRIEEMDREDRALEDDPAKVPDAKYAAIKELVAPGKIELLFDRRRRGATLLEHAKATGTSDSWLRRILTRYWWYGCTPGALIELKMRQGGPGKARLVAGVAKRGAPGAEGRADKTSPLRGVNYGPFHREKFIEAILRFHIGENKSLAQTWRDMKDALYVTEVHRSDGGVFFRKTPLHRIPTPGMFVRYAPLLIAELGLKNENLGSLDHASKEASRSGHARDITCGPGDIFDMDSTEFDFELVAAFDSATAIGRPTVYLVVDRYSTCIIGFYLECKPEQWEGYRRALFCAFTPKNEMLSRLGSKVKDWRAYGVPNGVFCDRGPARGEGALKALAIQLKLERVIAPPRMAKQNSVVETKHKIVQAVLAQLEGGYDQNSDQRSKDRKKKARSIAKYTERQFLLLLISVMDDHNKFADKTDLLTPSMGNIAGTPEAVYLWGIRNSVVDHHRHRNMADLYAKLLPSERKSVTNKGVRFRHRYDSDELQAWRKRQAGKSIFIDMHWDVDPKFLYWRPTPDTWSELEMSRADQLKAANMSWEDLDAFRDRNIRKRLRTDAKGHRQKTFRATASDMMREAAEKSTGTPGRGAQANAPVRDARRYAAKESDRRNASEGRRLLKGLTGGPSTPGPEVLAPPTDAPSPPKARADGEPTIEELLMDKFK